MVNVAILGFGTVGSGTAEVIEENSKSIALNAGEEIKIKYILDVKEFPGSPFEKLVIRDFSVVENDPEVSIVVETIGGVSAAYEYTKRALLAGKSVVTSNKELVASHGYELLQIACEKNVNYFFEASVGGGIPIIRPINECLAANKIHEIFGILNGTSNYILTKMITAHTDFYESLREAQDLGYAERNPSADIEGYDAARKICILADLCFGKNVSPEDISVRGITDVTLNDVEYARRVACKIKLLGRAFRLSDGRVCAYVAPHLIGKTSLLSNVDGVMNGIVVHGNAIGECMFYGPGAGKRPTASAVVADIIDAVKHREKRKPINWNKAEEGYVASADEVPMRWYVRTGSGLETIGKAFGNLRLISYPGEYPGAGPGEYAFLTEEMTGREGKKRLSDTGVRSLFPVLD